MAVNKVIYNGKTLIDISDASVTPETLLSGVTAYNAAGEKIDGTAAEGSSGGGGIVKVDILELTPYSGEEEGELPYYKMSVEAGQKLVLTYYLTKKQGYVYDGRKCGITYYGSPPGSSYPIADAELNTEATLTITTGSSGTISFSGYYNDSVANGELATNSTDRVYGKYIKVAKLEYRELPELSNPATAEQIVEGYDALNAAGDVVAGTNPYEKTTTDAEVTTQADLIEQIRAVLQEKAAGSGGDDGDDTVKALIERTVTEIESDVTTVGSYAFTGCSKLVSASFPCATTIAGNALSGTNALTSLSVPLVVSVSSNILNGSKLPELRLPSATTISNSAFVNATKLVTLDLPVVQTIGTYVFNLCCSLTALILRSEAVATLANANAFTNAYHFLGTVNATYNPDGLTDGYIYVPSALVEEYKAATNWATYADQFRALEDYTVDGTITGELDETKI